MVKQRKRKKPKDTYIVVGMTLDELSNELKQIHHAELERMAPEVRKRCYLCKRRNGDESILLQDGSKEIRTGKVRIEPTEIDLGEGGILVYHLCLECSWLLTGLARQS